MRDWVIRHPTLHKIVFKPWVNTLGKNKNLGKNNLGKILEKPWVKPWLYKYL